MKNPFLLLSGLFFVLLLNACHRPYALVQRTPSPRFQSPQHIANTDTIQTNLVADKQTVSPQSVEPVFAEKESELTTASTRPALSVPAAQAIKHRVNRIESLLQESGKTQAEQPRPRPKSKSQMRLGNRIRDSLGLPLREELNGWQRIDWKLKSAIIVIGVAILFAILGLGNLALLFGLIGAVLLVLGLKRSFKSRRPWL